MTIDDLRQLLEYHYWARDRVLAAAARLSADQFTKDLGNSFKSIRDTLVHIYGSEQVWCARWKGESPPAMVPLDSFADVGSLERAWRDHEVTMREVLEQFAAAGPDTVVAYRDLKGHVWQHRFSDMLQHVVNHASYHRGQVTTMMRQMGVAPPASLDLITFHRERAAV